MKQLIKRDYHVIAEKSWDYSDRILDSIKSALDSVETEYSGGTALNEAIMQCADSNVGIYNAEILNNASCLRYKAESVVNEGLYSVDSRDFDLVSLLSCAWYEVINESLYSEIDTLIYNIAVNYTNDLIAKADEVIAQRIESYCDIDELDEDLQMSLFDIKKFDSCATYDEIESVACECFNEWINKPYND